MMLIHCDSGHGRLYSVVMIRFLLLWASLARNLLNLIVLAAFLEIKGNSSCGSHVKLEVRVYDLKDGLQLHVED